MRTKDRKYMKKAVGFILAAAVFLCNGCTKKSELIFDAENADTAEWGVDAEELKNTAVSEAEMPEMEQTMQSGTQEAESTGSEQQEICVHVCGAVVNPGVYVLPAGSRVYEAVEAAGGFAEDAHKSYVNQAQRLPDGVQLVIPTTEQVEEVLQTAAQGQTGADAAGKNGTDGSTEASVSAAAGIGIIGAETDAAVGGANAGTSENSDDGRININTASESELCNIPGIGTTRAAAIISYRQEHGSFQSIEDIMNVSGIKQGTYEKMKDSIKVD